MDYIFASEVTKKMGHFKRWVEKPCEENRIPDVVRFSRVWLIPKDAEKLKDVRFKTTNKNNLQLLEERRRNEKNIDN